MPRGREQRGTAGDGRIPAGPRRSAAEPPPPRTGGAGGACGLAAAARPGWRAAAHRCGRLQPAGHRAQGPQTTGRGWRGSRCTQGRRVASGAAFALGRGRGGGGERSRLLGGRRGRVY
ncbi:translation initiation factor IF-2-like [Pyrgilauda ruficollis]|uniref:translation initiation factor IF-2-like n=1 Tax=Pyrgilauda ruficollis TaxID=221976 RepID=UPI001B874052|nr:translation initiation factor IF-2-like [Pyrgilauda ruficollis]XP_041327918.1 translation initiation factor IF-2-like [Pyrgilauda ruficollis]